jgi:bifunctional UDP-N-acetylglucosamine pyrophosphorylase/glucosamine-1-phosphate N-acetyltransferase
MELFTGLAGRLKVVFLCGGVGRRMFPITKDKCLLEFLGKPLLQHHIEMAKECGFEDFVIVGNPLNIERIKELSSRVKARYDFLVQDVPLGMADALLRAKESIIDDEILVVNPNDIFASSLYRKMLEEAAGGGYSSLICAHRVKSYFPGGYLVVTSRHELLRIHEKPGPGNEPSDLVNIVVHLHREPRQLLKYIEDTVSSKDDVYERALTEMIRDGRKVKVVEYEGPWIAIKYPWNILDATDYFVRHLMVGQRSKSADISKEAVVEGAVHLGDNVKVLEGAVIRGPCYIGDNTLVGNNVLIRDGAQIGSSCLIGFSTEIARSYIGNGCLFHSNYVGDSVISDRCLFGAGSIAANLRFDEKTIKASVNKTLLDTGRRKLGVMVGEDSRIGVGCLIMPGVRVGSKSLVGPGVVLYDDVAANTEVYLKQEYEIRKPYRGQENDQWR